MKSQKGITMISLIIYVVSFFMVTTVVAGIVTFFYNNVDILDTKIGSNSQYNKLNLYMLNECKKAGNSLFAWKNSSEVEGTLDNYGSLSVVNSNDIESEFYEEDFFSNSEKAGNNAFITFKDSDNNKHSFIYVEKEKNLYYDSIKLCDNVEDFKFKLDYSSGKTVLKIFVNIDGTSFSTEYVVAS